MILPILVLTLLIGAAVSDEPSDCSSPERFACWTCNSSPDWATCFATGEYRVCNMNQPHCLWEEFANGRVKAQCRQEDACEAQHHYPRPDGSMYCHPSSGNCGICNNTGVCDPPLSNQWQCHCSVSGDPTVITFDGDAVALFGLPGVDRYILSMNDDDYEFPSVPVLDCQYELSLFVTPGGTTLEGIYFRQKDTSPRDRITIKETAPEGSPGNAGLWIKIPPLTLETPPYGPYGPVTVNEADGVWTLEYADCGVRVVYTSSVEPMDRRVDVYVAKGLAMTFPEEEDTGYCGNCDDIEQGFGGVPFEVIAEDNED